MHPPSDKSPTTAERQAWFDRMAARAVSKLNAMPKWKQDSLRAQIAKLGRGEENVG